MTHMPCFVPFFLALCLAMRLVAADPVVVAVGQADALRASSEERVMREYRRLIARHGQDPDWPEGVRVTFAAFRRSDRSTLVDDLANYADAVEDPEARAQVLLRCAFQAHEAGREATPFEAAATAVVPPGPPRARILLSRVPGKDGATQVLLLRAALAEDPVNREIHQALMPLLIEQERWAEAVALGEAWLALDPDEPRKLSLATLRLRNGQAELAGCQARALFRGPDPRRGDENAVLVAACALLALGQEAQAQALVESCPPGPEDRRPFQPLPPEHLQRVLTWSARVVQARRAKSADHRRESWGIDPADPAVEDAQRRAAGAKAEVARNARRAAEQARAEQLVAAELAARCPACTGTRLRPVRCPICAGSGLEDALVATGERRQSREVEGAYLRYRTWRDRKPCRTCSGEGQVLWKCEECGGTGRRR